MSTRLQVVMDDAEYRELERAARRRGVTVSQWVRDAIRAMRREQPSGNSARKLAIIREGAHQAYPAPGIGQMLEEIERGYGVTEGE